MKALVQRVQAGDGDAFAELFGMMHQPVLNYVYRTVTDRQVAEDVTQDAFIRAHQRIDQLGPPWDFKSWVYRIAGNLAVDHLRASKRFVDVEEPGEMSGPPSTRRPAEKRVQRDQERSDVQTTLALLPTTLRQALILREINDLSYEEVARALEVTYDNARQLVHRGRLKFRQAHGLRMLAASGAERCRELDDLISAALDGELGSAERKAVKQHIAGCEYCKETERDMKKVAALVAGLVPILPSPGWTQNVLEQIGVPHPEAASLPSIGSPPQSPGGASWLGSWGAKTLVGAALGILGGGLLLAAGAYAFGLFQPNSGSQTVDPVQATVAAALARTPRIVATQPVPAENPPVNLVPVAPIASPTPTTTATEILGPPFVKALMNANCRSGPGSVFDILGYLLEAQLAPVNGRLADSTWWRIESQDGPGSCWIWDYLIEKQGDFSSVPVIAPPPTPTPADSQPPTVSISHSPTGSGRPLTNDPVTFSASANDDRGVAVIEIYVRSPGASTPALVKSCSNTNICIFVGGPYSAGDGEYYARARDHAGNEIQSKPNPLHVDWYIGFWPGMNTLKPV
ncbi:MAG: sigma-70 family RNA polymerase sigma factor [Lysobacterales bacterium]|nr:MAG: sigma-70 family RNA polymerase sigma factor [Xanthomonadales bacterium]